MERPTNEHETRLANFYVWKAKHLKRSGDLEEMVKQAEKMISRRRDNALSDEERSVFLDACISFAKARLDDIFTCDAKATQKAQMARIVAHGCSKHVEILWHARGLYPAEHYESDKRELCFWQNTAKDLEAFYRNRWLAHDCLEGVVAIPVPFSGEKRFYLNKGLFYPIGDGNQVLARLEQNRDELKWELNAAMQQFPDDTFYAVTHAVAIVNRLEILNVLQVQAFTDLYKSMEMWPGNTREPTIFRIKKEMVVEVVGNLLASFRVSNGTLREVSSNLDDEQSTRFLMAYFNAQDHEMMYADIRKAWVTLKNCCLIKNYLWKGAVAVVTTMGYVAGTLPLKPIFFLENDEDDLVGKTVSWEKALNIFKRNIPGIWHEKDDHLYCFQYDDGSLAEDCDPDDYSRIHLSQPVANDL